MIVISGALVLLALVLLVIGLFSNDLVFVYASIGVSLASFAVLVGGILQRRKEDVSGEAVVPVPVPVPGTGAVKAGVTALQPVYAAPAGTADPATGTVLVVAGRPRYHAAGCRYVTGRDADAVDVADAREQGFTACGVCKPDANLGAPAGPEPVVEPELVDQVKVAAAAAPVQPGVIVIGDRGKYHTPECRYVRGAAGTLELTKAQAMEQGYAACGICKP